MNGFIPDSVDVNQRLSKMDDGDFVAMKGSIKKDGAMSKTTKSILSNEEFLGLFKHCENLIKTAMDEIIKGNITLQPFLNKDNSPCEYCNYDSICLFDGDIDDYREFSDKKKEDFIDA